MTPETRTPARPGVRAAALVGIAGVAGWSLAACAADTSDASYTDGSYSADGDYLAPSGTETITVEVTIEDDAVTAVTVTPHATDGREVEFQTEFADNIADEVVGKDLDELEVSRVAGSSLTSWGFNLAIDEIKQQAVASG